MIRRSTHTVHIGDTPLGSDYPVRLQSMVNTPTMDTKATVEQSIRIVEAGGAYVRITAPGIREAEHLSVIKKELHHRGYRVPLIADIHFNPKAAEIAARIVEKVRINPGNYIDKKISAPIQYTEAEYTAELERMRERLLPLINICKEYGTAVRIGSNHGSLSDRIVHRYGDTPIGMVESAMEFLRIFKAEQFDQIVVSMKASNVHVVVDSTRLLVKQMEKENMSFPLHLGVTEAGEGEDGRIKSAVGIGTLLLDGIGDTIRVSLTEDPEIEIPVAKNIVQYCSDPSKSEKRYPCFQSTAPNDPVTWVKENDLLPERVQFIDLTHQCPPFSVSGISEECPVVLKKTYKETDMDEMYVKAACDFGPLLLDGIGDGILMEITDAEDEGLSSEIALSVLQACRLRMSRPEYISCPSCGRTLFDLQATAAKIRARTSHLKGLKIGIMGCIVNGPGEMADADYGYVGTGPGKITLYKQREIVKRNIPEDQAVEELVNLIKANGDWKEAIT